MAPLLLTSVPFTAEMEGTHCPVSAVSTISVQMSPSEQHFFAHNLAYQSFTCVLAFEGDLGLLENAVASSFVKRKSPCRTKFSHILLLDTAALS